MSTPSKVVLVVEDDDAIRETLAEVLTDEGYVVRLASNGKDALAELRAAVPSLILLDLMMPVMDGFEFRARQMADAGLAAIPVVVLSADGDAAAKAAAMNAAGTLKKPVRLEDVLRVVHQHCGGAPASC